MPRSAGERVGPYEILTPIGAGGMGEVYRARDTRLDRLVAIKFSREQFSERFHREARAVAALSHPNICHLYDVGPDYLVMEYIEGRPIHPPGDPHAVIELGAQIADGLAAAHRAGIVHRDLKPDNILLTPDGRVKILDFGLAVLEPASAPAAGAQTMAATDPGTTVGTVAYMSPEQARGEPVDARSDLWSAGVILYELATRERPFDGATAAVVFDAILNKAPIPVRERNPKVPIELSHTIDRLLEKDRALRYQSAADLRADLKRTERDASSSRSVTAAAQTRPGTRRQTMIAAAAIATIVLVAAGFFWRRAQATPLTERDVVILADVTNTTGEAVFDNTLRAALSIQLEQSPFLKIMSDDRMREALRLMERSPGERITADIAREICDRFGEKATINGAIARLGNAYALTLQAINCRNGEALAREQVQADSQEHVLEAISKAARSLRGSLGESLGSVEKLDRPLTEVTTSSLEAFQAFAAGRASLNNGQPLVAIKQFERATTLDPNFAMAWWFLSSAYQNAGTGVRPAFLEKAFELRDSLTESEKLSIETAYYTQRTGEWDKGADSAQLWSRTYPRTALPHFILVGLRTFQGQPDEALREVLEAIRLEPDNATFIGGLMGVYARMDRFDEAKAIAQKAIEKKTDSEDVHLSLLRIAYIQDDRAAIERETRWFAGKPGEYASIVVQASSALVRGQRRRAAQLLQQAAEMAKSRGLPAAGGLNPLDDALVGSCPPTESIGPGNYLLMALCGDPAAALAAAENVPPERARPSAWSGVQLPMIRAAAAIRQNKPDAAVEGLKPAVTHDLYAPQAPHLRGLAYLAARMGVEAAAEFQKVIDHQGIHWRWMQVLPRDTGPLRPIAYVGLARAAALTGDTAKARKAYQDFLALWKDADDDIPILLEARKEYAALK